MTTANKIRPPAHLRAETKVWWKQVTDDFELEDHHVRILNLACESWDRGQQAREDLEKHGLIYHDRFDQPRSRPEVAIERDSRVAFARLLRELALDVNEPAETPRPAKMRGR